MKYLLVHALYSQSRMGVVPNAHAADSAPGFAQAVLEIWAHAELACRGSPHFEAV